MGLTPRVQRCSDIWKAMHLPRERERIKRARPFKAA
jgi:antitoxin HigA-1